MIEFINDSDGDEFLLGGLAGTGKSTVLGALYDQVGNDESIVWCCPTNRACRVAATKGVPAVTIHSAMYKPIATALAEQSKEIERDIAEMIKAGAEPREIGTLKAALTRLRKRIEDAKALGREATSLSFHWNPESLLAKASTVVIDEASMVGGRLLRDMGNNPSLSIVFIGDHGQLPPVKDQQIFKEESLDFELTEIFRQEEGSGILDAAVNARKSGLIKLVSIGSEYNAIRKGQGVPWEEIDVALAWKNTSVFQLAQTARDAAGIERGSIIQKGEPLLAMELVNANRNRSRVHNGTFWKFVEWKKPLPKWVAKKNPPDGLGDRDYYFRAVIEDDTGMTVTAPLSVRSHVQGVDKFVKDAPYWGGFAWGYAATVHKSQGGEWNSVFIYDETSWWRMKDARQQKERKQWAYTALTRARRKVFVTTPTRHPISTIGNTISASKSETTSPPGNRNRNRSSERKSPKRAKPIRRKGD